jgi:hypothetical protein
MKTTSTSHPSHPAAKRGSTLVFTLILATALLMIVGGLLAIVTTDKRVNKRVALTDEARNASEGAVEVAAAEFDRRALSYGTLPDNPLTGFTIPSSVRSTLALGHVVAGSIEFKAGNLSPLPDGPETINPSDPFNAPDPDKGKPMSLRHGFIYGKATATDPVTGDTVTSYVSTLMQVRTQSWLNFGVFGNLDLEFHSGPAMDVAGPVHSNRNIYLTAGSGVELRMFDSCTAKQGIYRKYKYGGISVTHTGTVKLAPKSDPLASELLSMATTQDSRMTGFKDFAEARWKGFVQDVTFGVDEFRPPGMLPYIEDDYTTTSVNETRNHAYAFIEPQLSTSSTDDAANSVFAGHKGTEIENLKVSAMAGITIRVKDGYTAAQWAAIGQADNDNAAFDAFPGFELVFFTGTDPARPLNRSNYPLRGAGGRPIETVIPTLATRMKPQLRNRLFAAIRLVEYKESGGTVGNCALNGTSFKRELSSADISNAVDGTPTTFTSPSDNPTWSGLYDRRQGYVYPNGSGTNSNSGLKGAHHVLYIDLDKFNDFLNSPAEDWEDVAAPGTKLYDPPSAWSGVLYVQLPLEPLSTAAVSARETTDKVRPARAPTSTNPGFAVALRNGRRLPSLASRRDDGFVLGCNGPVYIMGHYNADGSSSTGSSSDPDPGWDEIPAVIAADAVTLLSSSWTDARFRESYKTPLNSAAFTEVSTAIFAGVVPTRLNTSGNGLNNQWMGGVHNFVRFLEDWTGDTYRYRGSIALLFENEVSKAPWYQNYYAYWYNPPARDVGYHFFFASGRAPKAWPPFLRSNRRIKVDRISAADYSAGPPTPP